MKRIALLIVGLLIGAIIVVWIIFNKEPLPELLPPTNTAMWNSIAEQSMSNDSVQLATKRII
jgi:hypothetical protein